MEVVQSCLSESDRLLFTPDLINFWLAGEKGNEITMASTSQMLYQKNRDWNRQLLDQLGIPTQMLVELWEPGHYVGLVTGASWEKIALVICLSTPWVSTTPHRPWLGFRLGPREVLPTSVVPCR